LAGLPTAKVPSEAPMAHSGEDEYATKRFALDFAPVALGALLALAAFFWLSLALEQVPNRLAFNWDSARRAMLDVGAADALRAWNPFAFLGFVAGPETWPTLRLLLAAPLHVLGGPTHALAVEIGLSLALTASIFLFLGFAARRMAPKPAQALLVLAVSSAALVGARALYVHAANGMLEVPSALLTLGATTAWLAAREDSLQRPWGLALLGNLLFHVRWQHGLIFAAAVLLTEVGNGHARACAHGVFRALTRAAQTWTGRAFLAVAALLGLCCLWVLSTGGAVASTLGGYVSVRSADGPMAFAALALFAFVEVALWRGRSGLAELPERVKFLWVWLFSPMALWLLIPFTWRLRTLRQISAYDMWPPPEGLAARLRFYPEAAWDSWSPASARWLVAALLVATLLAAWRSTDVRRRLLPIAAVCGLELLALLLLSRRNYQERFLLNLVPLLALSAAAWVPAVRSGALRLALAGTATLLLAFVVVPTWSRPALAATLSEGFVDAETGEACRSLAEALPIQSGVLLNETSLLHRQACAMWVTFAARERGADVDVRAVRPRGLWKEALLVTEGCEALQAPQGLLAEGPLLRAGPLCGQRFHVTAQPSKE
jgi:hypothetical protein